MKPCYALCQECEHWDDVNGCWAGSLEFLDDACAWAEEEECEEWE